MRDLAALTAGDFEPHVGQSFETRPEHPDDPLKLTLVRVDRLGPRAGNREPFSLHFSGPAAPVLPEAIHHLVNDPFGALEIFLVPVSSGPDGLAYQAIFT